MAANRQEFAGGTQVSMNPAVPLQRILLFRQT